jgi:hypothetical protein
MEIGHRYNKQTTSIILEGIEGQGESSAPYWNRKIYTWHGHTCHRVDGLDRLRAGFATGIVVEAAGYVSSGPCEEDGPVEKGFY